MLANELIESAWSELNDDGTRWPTNELLGYLHEAEILIAFLKGEAYSVLTAMTLVPGTRQTLPDRAIRLGKVGCNIDDAGNPGPVPRLITPAQIDGLLPTWHSAPPTATVKYVIYDPAEPKVFGTYPPQPAGTTQKLNGVCPTVPPAFASELDAIHVPDEYSPALLDYQLHRAFMKDAEVPESASRSQGALAAFAAKLGVPVKTVQQAQQPSAGTAQ